MCESSVQNRDLYLVVCDSCWFGESNMFFSAVCVCVCVCTMYVCVCVCFRVDLSLELHA